MPRRGENIHKRKDGRWEGRYIKNYDVNGKAKYGSVYAKSYLEVKKKLNEKKLEATKNTLPSKDNCTSLREVLYLWLDNNQIRLKKQTYSKYKRLIDTHIIPNIGFADIRSITSVYINKFLYEKTENGRLDHSGGLSPSYVRTLAFILNAALKFAAREGLCNLITGSIVAPPNRSKRMDVLSVEEQLKLEHYICSNLNGRNIGILMSLYAGMRIGEVCALKWSDIDFEEKTIHIKNTVSRIAAAEEDITQPKTKLEITEAKTYSSNRIIPIPEILYKLFLQIKGNYYGEFVLNGSSYPYTDPRALQYVFHKSLKACGLRDINFHALRHTFATRCIESGMDVKSLSEILGHSNVNITLNTYVHSSVILKRKQMEAMVSFCGH